jgi:hypothetical protein
MVFGTACFPTNILFAKVSGALISLGFAVLTERWFETPIRYRKREQQWPVWVVAILSCAAPVVAWAVQVASMTAIDDNVYVAAVLETEQEYLDLGCDSPAVLTEVPDRCRVDGSSPVHVVLIGDSNARQHIPAIRKVVQASDASLSVSTLSACPFIPHMPVNRGSSMVDCQRWVEQSIEELTRNPPSIVLLSGAWESYTQGEHLEFVDVATGVVASTEAERRATIVDGIAEVGAALETNGSRVFLIDPIPKFYRSDASHELLKIHRPSLENQGGCSFVSFYAWPEKCLLHRNLESEQWVSADFGAEIHREAAEKSGAETIDLRDALCPEGVCSTGRGSTYYYVNRGHISPDGSALTESVFERQLAPAIEQLESQPAP